MPQDTSPGDYDLLVEMVQANGDKTIGKASFKIESEESFLDFWEENKFTIIIAIGVVILILILTLIVPRLGGMVERRKIKTKIKKIVKRKSLYY